MTFRTFLTWTLGVSLVAVLIYLGYVYVFNPDTSKVATEASFEGASLNSVPRSGIIESFSSESGQIIFIESTSGTKDSVRIDGTTIIRTLQDNTYVDASTEVLLPGALLSVGLEPTSPDLPAGAIDIRGQL